MNLLQRHDIETGLKLELAQNDWLELGCQKVEAE